jgi:DNA-binding response OmpR family regulator
MRLLIVEDEYKIANALRRGLTSEGYAVDVANNGDDGLASALNDPLDLIILDRMLPGGYDGIAIVKEMRQNNVSTPVLLLTAKDAVSDRVAGLDAGADDYLTKPFAFEELLARIRVLTRSVDHKEASPELRYDCLRLDLRGKVLFRDEQRIELSLKEYALLDYLMRNPETVLSKQQIIDHVWNYDADILPNTVEAFIAMLRNKIDKPFDDKKFLQTVRGFGYKLERQ